MNELYRSTFKTFSIYCLYEMKKIKLLGVGCSFETVKPRLMFSLFHILITRDVSMLFKI